MQDQLTHESSLTEQISQRPKPAKPLVPRDGGVRRRRGREDEELGLAKPSLLEPVLRALAKRPVVRRLADEGDDLRQ
ncbi:MAG TPA: hypothetical protein VFU84_08085 [Gaiellaceae bacterium]|nr:hypothetical protein [Gaiellaceae bacterium]